MPRPIVHQSVPLGTLAPDIAVDDKVQAHILVLSQELADGRVAQFPDACVD